MSLTKCKICGQPLSEEALFCPHCGHPYHIREYLIIKPLPTPEQATDAPMEVVEEQEVVAAPPVAPAAEIEEPEAEQEAEDSEEDEEARTQARYRRNERAKLWIFVIISALILATILFFYFTTTPGQGAEADEDTEMVADSAVTELASPETLAPIDSPAAVVAQPAATPVAAPKPVVKPAAPAPAPAPAPAEVEEPREVTVSSLREQVAPSHSEPTTPTVE